jgi:hypothetical protein
MRGVNPLASGVSMYQVGVERTVIGNCEINLDE